MDGARFVARVILNEVNSSNPSLLHGYVEVAGNRAQELTNGDEIFISTFSR